MKFLKRWKILIIVILLAGFFALLNYVNLSSKIKNFFYRISSPVQKVLWWKAEKIAYFSSTLADIKNLKKENEKLKLDVQTLRAENAILKELKGENETLKQSLGLGLEKEFKLTMARVSGKDISQDYLLIDKGGRDGLKKDLTIITSQRTLLGKISEVYDDFSRVNLISDKNMAFDAKDQESEVVGVVKGKGHFQLFFDLIPQEKEMKEGDSMVTVSLGGIFPGGILLGHIAKISKSALEPFQQVEIKPSFDIKNLDVIFVILDEAVRN